MYNCWPVAAFALRLCVVYATLFMADFLTQKYDISSDAYKTTASMPYWSGCTAARQKAHKLFYTIAQFGATSACVLNCEGLEMGTLVGIQGAAFLMTLTRKGLISPYAYHMLYTAALAYTYVLGTAIVISRLDVCIFVKLNAANLITVVTTWMRIRGVDKYTVWAMVAPLALFVEMWFERAPLQSNGERAFVSVCFLAAATAGVLGRRAYAVPAARQRCEVQLTSNVVYVERRSACELKIDIVSSKLTKQAYPGQHVIVTNNGKNARMYTPVRTQKDGQITLHVKLYPHNPNGMSTMMSRLSRGDPICVQGPTGATYYVPGQRTLCTSDKSIQVAQGDLVGCACAGSGVTALYAIASAMLRDGVRVRVVRVDRSPEDRMMVDEVRALECNYESAPEALEVVQEYTHSGRPTQNRLAELLSWQQGDAEVRRAAAVVCGPPSFVAIAANAAVAARYSEVVELE